MHYPSVWELPCGKVRDTDGISAVVSFGRVFEETGLRITKVSSEVLPEFRYEILKLGFSPTIFN
jgi:coproporphyrinogen III oxidase